MEKQIINMINNIEMPNGLEEKVLNYVMENQYQKQSTKLNFNKRITLIFTSLLVLVAASVLVITNINSGGDDYVGGGFFASGRVDPVGVSIGNFKVKNNPNDVFTFDMMYWHSIIETDNKMIDTYSRFNYNIKVYIQTFGIELREMTLIHEMDLDGDFIKDYSSMESVNISEEGTFMIYYKSVPLSLKFNDYKEYKKGALRVELLPTPKKDAVFEGFDPSYNRLRTFMFFFEWKWNKVVFTHHS